MPSKVRKKPKGGWNGERVATSVYRRAGGTFCVSISVQGRNRQASFPTLKEAVAWRDEQKSARVPPRKRAWSAGINALHRSTWSPEDVHADHDETRRMIESAPRRKQRINGRIFTVVSLPYIAPGRPTSWRLPRMEAFV